VLVNDRMGTGPGAKPVPRSPVELARLDTLVRNAVGADTTRGDKVNVVNVAFDGLTAPAVDEAPDLWSRAAQAEKPIVAGAALLAILVAAFFVTRALKPAGAPPAVAGVLGAGAAVGVAVATGAAPGDDDPDDAASAGALPAGEPAALTAGAAPAAALLAGVAPAEAALPPQLANPVRDQVVAIIEQRPDAATRVVRAWLKQD
jgi:flagellar M-ring protein FliF